VRPRYGKYDIPENVNEQLEATRYTPKPEQPKGRLSRVEKDELFRDESRMNPLASFHDLYKCLDKGRDGSPTYDEAGFQLDFDKVARWMKRSQRPRVKMSRSSNSSSLRLQRNQISM
jgi:hypothetical protein